MRSSSYEESLASLCALTRELLEEELAELRVLCMLNVTQSFTATILLKETRQIS